MQFLINRPIVPDYHQEGVKAVSLNPPEKVEAVHVMEDAKVNESIDVEIVPLLQQVEIVEDGAEEAKDNIVPVELAEAVDTGLTTVQPRKYLSAFELVKQ